MKQKTFKGSNHLVLVGNSPFTTIVLEELSRSGIPEKTALVIISELQVASVQQKSFPGRIHHIRGLATNPDILESANAQSADAILIMTYGEPDADRKALQITRVLVENFNVSPKRITVPVTGESAARRIHAECSREIRTIPVNTLFARIIAQSSRQKHLSEVYEEIFSYHGNEFYTVSSQDVTEASFARCLRLFENACAVGIRSGGVLRLNPPMNTVVGPDDSILVLAAAKHTIKKNKALLPAPDNTGISSGRIQPLQQESFLFLGWNPLCTDILTELDRYAPKGSRAHCISLPSRESLVIIPELGSLSVQHSTGDIFSQAFLSTIPWEHYENIVLPGNSSTGDGDTRELRRILEDVLGERGFTNHISSVYWFPQENPAQDLPQGIVSVSFILRMTAQELFHDEFTLVIEELTTEKGAEIYLKPVENYVSLDKPVDFYTILEAARRKNETAIGYVQDGVIQLNPEKSSRVRFYHFDKIVVLSDENF